MKTICFFNTAKAWGGGEKWHLEVSQYLNDRGFSVFVIAHPDSVLAAKLSKTNIPFQTIALGNLSFLNPVKRVIVKKTLAKRQLETIVMNLSSDVKIAGPIAKQLGVKRIIYRRGSAIPIKNNRLNRYLFKNVLTEILANSLATKKTINQKNPTLFPKDKITVIHNGIAIPDNLNRISWDNKKHFTLINLGRLEYQKNQTFLIDVAKQLEDRKVEFKMIIGGEGRLRTDLEQKISEFNLRETISMAGFIDNPMEFLKQGDIFLLPSHWEGFGYVLAEAGLCGLPSVAFNISSNPEVIKQNKTGVLTPPNDVDAFVEAILKLSENKEDLIEKGKAAREYIINHFDKAKKLKEIEGYLLHG
ncbi:glycosyltransferase [Croceivirga sp. JEA036]|uniref:glycosyltransferase n=1 Tax=Croceivirga sp. JEA036 TaxID=2721162 RepID=UPI001439E484|nr:glycosyltransferase [Croceivirga sp. JEA036]NJB37532.1 glycosyltransferase [Croceivirga sp. JEA036]